MSGSGAASRTLASAADSTLRRAGRWGLRLALLVWFVFAGTVFALRYWILPDVDRFRPDLEQLASKSLGLGVRIGGLTGGWDGLRPELSLADVRIQNRKGETVLAFSRVEAVLSWRSLAVFEPSLHRLAIESPVLHVQRELDGRILVAGFPVGEEATSDPSLADWILRQHQIVITDALLIWEDGRRGAPPLFLERLNLRLESSGSRHRFGLNGRPSGGLATRLDLRGDLRGDAVRDFANWRGQLFVETESVDLAGWRTWVDYPVDLPQGRGGLRLWLGVDRGMPVEMTADVALRDVRLRLSPKLPELDLAELSGRLRGRHHVVATRANKIPGQGADAVAFSARQLTLLTRDGVRIEPTDLAVEWTPQADGSVRGTANANLLDIEVIARLAATLPIDERSRGLLAEFAPRGRISELKATWHGTAEALAEYSLKARFEGLAARANGLFPGFDGLGGSVDADEDEGRLVLKSGPSSLDMPAVFAEPLLSFDALAAKLRWTIRGGVLEAVLEQAGFSGPDATGSAQGTYRRKVVEGGAGVIDLTASLEQANGRAVWRYMPKRVSAEARQWLRRGITAGTATDVRLVLRGDLERFPFRDPKEGSFLVTAKVRDADLDYADKWPRINDIAGELRFEGAGMSISARQGSILGTRLAATTAEIADLGAAGPQLEIKGTVNGPTSEFLRFVEASPVGDWIGHFAEDMRATGNGKLDLGLSIPLAAPDRTRVKGDFQFLDNQVVVDAALPPVTQVRGRIQFTGDEVTSRDLTGIAFGAPLRMAVRTQGDRVGVVVQGSASVAALRQHYDWPVFDHLSGTAAWKADVRVRRKQAEILVESSLQGVSSSLPEPFNKPASEILPLRVEKLPAGDGSRGPAREQWRASLGRVASAQWVRRAEAESGAGLAAIEQGALAIGEPLRLPDRGLSVALTVNRLDLDFWRGLLGAAGSAAPGARPSPLPQLSIKAREVLAFGRDWHEVGLRSAPTAEGLQGRIESREATGDWAWQQGGKGRLRARLKQFMLPAAGEGGSRAAVSGAVGEALDSLPGLDIAIEQFAIGSRKLGRLEMEAANESRVWRINRLLIANPEGQLVGSGRWRFTGSDRTQLDFKLEAKDVGKLLERFGYADAVRRGTATLEGRLGWYGVPTAIDYPSLTGEVRLAAEKGQFAKLEPGIGKLLSLLSLQMLPRRITLDFRDVFSEGFAFDTIAGRFVVNNGQMRTDDLKVEGPTAKVLMRGDIDLQHETQNLRVAIQPEIGGTVSLGAAIVNPIAGLAALIAQKILQDPLNKAFAFEYAITGSWADPKVDKLVQPISSPDVKEIPDESSAKRQ